MIIDFQKKNSYTFLYKKNRNYNLIFTSGCFDLFHIGHLNFIQMIKAKKIKNAKLLIALHSDKSISKIKGNQRPLITENHRLQIINNIKLVDFVGIWYGWESIIELVKELKPDFLATTQDKINKSNWNNSWKNVSNELNSRLISIKKNYKLPSTSRLISKIKKL